MSVAEGFNTVMDLLDNLDLKKIVGITGGLYNISKALKRHRGVYDFLEMTCPSGFYFFIILKV